MSTCDYCDMHIAEDECENILGFFCSQDCRGNAVKEFIRALPTEKVKKAFSEHNVKVNEVEYRGNCITVTSSEDLNTLPEVMKSIRDDLGFDMHKVFENNSVVFHFS